MLEWGQHDGADRHGHKDAHDVVEEAEPRRPQLGCHEAAVGGRAVVLGLVLQPLRLHRVLEVQPPVRWEGRGKLPRSTGLIP